MPRSITETSAAESTTSITEPTVSSESLTPWGSQRPWNEWSRYRVNSPLRYSNAALLRLVVTLTICAASSRAAERKIWEECSGEKALLHVQHLVDLGPHPVGSDAIEKAREYIEAQLRHSGWQVTRQGFTEETPRGKVRFVNLIARFSGDGNAAAPSFLLCSHYD